MLRCALKVHPTSNGHGVAVQPSKPLSVARPEFTLVPSNAAKAAAGRWNNSQNRKH